MKGNSLVPASRSRPSASAPSGRRKSPPKTNPAGAGFGRGRALKWGGPLRGSQAAPDRQIVAPSLKMGRYMPITIQPISTPSTTMIMGSIRLASASTELFTSCS